MSFKILLSFVLSVVIFDQAVAQDVLYKTNGSTEEVKLLEVTPSKITYKRWDNQDGPNMVISRRHVKKIRYENGTEEEGRITDRVSKRSFINISENSNYGKNIITVSPVFMSNTSVVGIGVGYERLLGKKNVFGITLPLGYSFDYVQVPNNIERSMLWLNPGVKFYPTGNTGPVRYAVGLSFVTGFGHEKYTSIQYDYSRGTSRVYDVNDPITVFGGMLHNSLNLQPTANLYLGLDAGVGLCFLVDDAVPGDYHPVYYTTDIEVPLLQFQFKIGYRF